MALKIDGIEKLIVKEPKSVPLTVVIWTDPGVGVRFFQIKKDLTHMNHYFLGSANPKYEVEISALRNTPEFQKRTPIFPTEAVKSGAVVIVCGWLL